MEGVNLFTLKFRMLDHIVDDISKLGELSYLDPFPYEHFNVTIKKFIKINSMRKTCTRNKAAYAMNVVPPLLKKLCSSSAEKQICSININGKTLTSDRVVNITCLLMAHVKRDGSAELKIYIAEAIR